MTVQNSRSGTEVEQLVAQSKPTKVRHVGKSHADYWKPRLKKRTYLDSDGRLVEIPEWQIRIAHVGQREWFNTETANADAAAEKARRIYLSLIAKGWETTLKEYKPKAERKEQLTVDEFADTYRKALLAVEYPPSHRTSERYIKSLKFLAKRIRAKLITDVTPEKVSTFKSSYLDQGRKEGRAPESVRISCNAVLRNVAAMFSGQMLTEYAKSGLSLINPFAGQKLRRIQLKAYSPMNRELLDSIWQAAVTLRDGNPNEPERKIIRVGGRKAKKRPEDRAKRWKAPDFRSPQPGAYVLLLLELGLGLRRNEADKAEWDWFFTDKNGRHYINVKQTAHFIPKSRESRVIPVEKFLYEAIQATRQEVSPFIVPGRLPKRYQVGKEPKNLVYRCEPDHRALAFWLRKRGISDEKPCHLLRKEFGSYVATSFGLFHAQRMLGHSDPSVTDAFYAGLVNMPELNHAKIAERNPEPALSAELKATAENQHPAAPIALTATREAQR